MFPQLGGIREFLGLPPGERALYEQFTLAELEDEARRPALRLQR